MSDYYEMIQRHFQRESCVKHNLRVYQSYILPGIQIKGSFPYTDIQKTHISTGFRFVLFYLVVYLKSCQAAERSLKRTCNFSLHLLAVCSPKCLVNSNGNRSILVTLNHHLHFFSKQQLMNQDVQKLREGDMIGMQFLYSSFKTQKRST